MCQDFINCVTASSPCKISACMRASHTVTNTRRGGGGGLRSQVLLLPAGSLRATWFLGRRQESTNFFSSGVTLGRLIHFMLNVDFNISGFRCDKSFYVYLRALTLWMAAKEVLGEDFIRNVHNCCSFCSTFNHFSFLIL